MNHKFFENQYNNRKRGVEPPVTYSYRERSCHTGGRSKHQLQNSNYATSIPSRYDHERHYINHYPADYYYRHSNKHRCRQSEYISHVPAYDVSNQIIEWPHQIEQLGDNTRQSEGFSFFSHHNYAIKDEGQVMQGKTNHQSFYYPIQDSPYDSDDYSNHRSYYASSHSGSVTNLRSKREPSVVSNIHNHLRSNLFENFRRGMPITHHEDYTHSSQAYTHHHDFRYLKRSQPEILTSNNCTIDRINPHKDYERSRILNFRKSSRNEHDQSFYSKNSPSIVCLSQSRHFRKAPSDLSDNYDIIKDNRIPIPFSQPNEKNAEILTSRDFFLDTEGNIDENWNFYNTIYSSATLMISTNSLQQNNLTNHIITGSNLLHTLLELTDSLNKFNTRLPLPLPLTSPQGEKKHLSLDPFYPENYSISLISESSLQTAINCSLYKLYVSNTDLPNPLSKKSSLPQTVPISITSESIFEFTKFREKIIKSRNARALNCNSDHQLNSQIEKYKKFIAECWDRGKRICYFCGFKECERPHNSKCGCKWIRCIRCGGRGHGDFYREKRPCPYSQSGYSFIDSILHDYNKYHSLNPPENPINKSMRCSICHSESHMICKEAPISNGSSTLPYRRLEIAIHIVARLCENFGKHFEWKGDELDQN